MDYRIHTDGASRGNPGPSSCAAILYRRMLPDHKWEHVGEASKYLGDKLTNNYAEYQGLITGLELAVKYGIKDTTLWVCSDSELLVKQMTGIYRFKNLDILHIAEFVNMAAASHGIKLNYEHVRRERNQAADRLCNIELDAFKARAKAVYAAMEGVV